LDGFIGPFQHDHILLTRHRIAVVGDPELATLSGVVVDLSLLVHKNCDLSRCTRFGLEYASNQIQDFASNG
jgi:hypothetical protein